MEYSDYEAIRKMNGLKDADVARATGITKSTFSDWKNGRSFPKSEKMIKIAKLLNIPMEVALDATDIDVTHDNPAEGLKVGDLFDGIGYYVNNEISEIADFLHKNPEYKVLFDASRKVKPEDIQKALTAIGLFSEE